MGWDAFAVYANGSSLSQFDFECHRLIFVEEQKKLAFQKAHEQVKEIAGVVDGGLMSGYLDCSACAEYLELIYDIDAWPNGPAGMVDLEPEQVQCLVERANREVLGDLNLVSYQEDDAWAYWSARKFMETCAELGLAIRFSY